MKKQTSKKARSKTLLAKSQKLNDMIFAGHHCQQLFILPHVHPKLRESSPRVCTLQTLKSKKAGKLFSSPATTNTHEKTLCNSCPVFGLPCLSQSISAAFEKRVVEPLFSTGMRPIVV